MPLSNEEQRLLDEMERNLYKHEADIVQTGGGPRVVNYTRVALGLLLVVAGLALVVVGVFVQLFIVGVAGFGVAVLGALLALSSSKPVDDEGAVRAEPQGHRGAASAAKRTSLMDRLSDEWDKRQ